MSWRDVGGVLTGGYAAYKTHKALGVEDKPLFQAIERSNPSANDFSRDKRRPDEAKQAAKEEARTQATIATRADELLRTPDPAPTAAPAPSTADTSLVNGKASDTLATIYRSQWEDYKARFVPLENEVMGAYKNPSLYRAAEDQARGGVYQTFANQPTQRNLSRYGVQMSPEQQAAVQRNMQLTRSATAANAVNETRRRMSERDEEIMVGGVSSKGV